MLTTTNHGKEINRKQKTSTLSITLLPNNGGETKYKQRDVPK